MRLYSRVSVRRANYPQVADSLQEFEQMLLWASRLWVEQA